MASVPNDHVVPLAPSFDTVGWFARDADILERAGHVLLDNGGADARPPRLLLAMDALELVAKEIRPVLDAAIATLTREIGPAHGVNLYGGQEKEWMNSFRLLQGAEVWQSHGMWIRTNNPVFGPEIHERFEWAASIGPEVLPPARKVRARVIRHLDELLGQDGVLCIPSSPSIALLKNSRGEELEQFRSHALALLCVAGLAGLPQVSLPLASYQGCPLGFPWSGRRAQISACWRWQRLPASASLASD